MLEGKEAGFIPTSEILVVPYTLHIHFSAQLVDSCFQADNELRVDPFLFLVLLCSVCVSTHTVHGEIMIMMGEIARRTMVLSKVRWKKGKQ